MRARASAAGFVGRAGMPDRSLRLSAPGQFSRPGCGANGESRPTIATKSITSAEQGIGGKKREAYLWSALK
jgi:hypothetical protein